MPPLFDKRMVPAKLKLLADAFSLKFTEAEEAMLKFDKALLLPIAAVISNEPELALTSPLPFIGPLISAPLAKLRFDEFESWIALSIAAPLLAFKVAPELRIVEVAPSALDKFNVELALSVTSESVLDEPISPLAVTSCELFITREPAPSEVPLMALEKLPLFNVSDEVLPISTDPLPLRVALAAEPLLRDNVESAPREIAVA